MRASTTVIPVNDTTPPLHPMKREQFRAESTLVVIVSSSSKFHNEVTDGIKTLKRGDTVDSPPTLLFASYDDLMAALTPRVLNLIGHPPRRAGQHQRDCTGR